MDIGSAVFQELHGSNGAGIISLPQGQKWLFGAFRHLFVRNFYNRFIKFQLNDFKITSKTSKVVLMGTPGIGKSSFGIYCVWKALEMKKTVIYQHGSAASFFTIFKRGEKPIRVKRDSAEDVPPEALEQNNVFIADSITPSGLIQAFTLFVSSPNRGRVYEWSKHRECETYFFPTWEMDELDLIREHIYYGAGGDEGSVLSQEELQTRFDSVGGVPRFIFEDFKWREHEDSLLDSVERFLDNSEYTNIKNKKNVYGISHRAIHIDVDRSTFTNIGYKPASYKVEEYIVDYLKSSERAKFVAFMDNCKGASGMQGLRGHVFEWHLVGYLMRTLKRRPITARSLDGKADIVIPPSENVITRTFTEVSDITDAARQDEDAMVIWQPHVSNHPASDFIITRGRDVYFIQSTVSNAHSITLRAKNPKLSRPALLDVADDLEGVPRGSSVSPVNYIVFTEYETSLNYKRTNLSEFKQGDRVGQYVVGVSTSDVFNSKITTETTEDNKST